MVLLAFILGACALVLLIAFALASLAVPRFQFFPPPGRRTWQYQLFWVLFRLLMVSLMFVCVLDFGGLGPSTVFVRVCGVLLLLLGFGMAFRITAYLGWRQAHGEAEGLIADGWFRRSRNPIYVFSLIGMFGLALVVNSAYLNWLLSGWALIYLLAPFVEEPWLAKQFGGPYRDYLRRVPRFLSWRSLVLKNS